MVVRLGAALCGGAILITCVAAATAKSTAAVKSVAVKAKENRKVGRSGASGAANRKLALDANGDESRARHGRDFVAGVAPFLCVEKPLKFADRFRPAQMIIMKSKLASNTQGMTFTIVGTASMYNPYRPGYREGGIETASGELYNPAAWTAAIQTELRGAFGGVGYGKDYRPAYALIESGGKQVIVKINDVGPLEPGRIIDFNQQTMYYFDPSLQRGLVSDIMITPLPGEGWVPGPVQGRLLISRANVLETPPIY
jgi:rare lipoprotein A